MEGGGGGGFGTLESITLHAYWYSQKQARISVNREMSAEPSEKQPWRALVAACSPLSRLHRALTLSSSWGVEGGGREGGREREEGSSSK